MEILDRFEAKIEALRLWVQEHPTNTILYHQFTAAAPLREEEVRRIEQQHAVSLPPEYRAFLRRFGDVDFGPGNVYSQVGEGLNSASQLPFPLTAPFLGCCSPAYQQQPAEVRWEQLPLLLEEWERIPGHAGIASLCEYGCGIGARLILAGAFRDRVWICQGDAAYYGPFGGLEVLHEEGVSSELAEVPRDYCFFEWYESWLDGQLHLTSL